MILLQDSAPPTGATVDVGEIGRSAAQLSDWQTITYFLAALLIMAAIERILSGYFAKREREALAENVRKEREAMASERDRMWSVSEQFGAAADKIGDAQNNVVTELQVQRALNARFEGVVTGLEHKVTTLLAPRLDGRG